MRDPEMQKIVDEIWELFLVKKAKQFGIDLSIPGERESLISVLALMELLKK